MWWHLLLIPPLWRHKFVSSWTVMWKDRLKRKERREVEISFVFIFIDKSIWHLEFSTNCYHYFNCIPKNLLRHSLPEAQACCTRSVYPAGWQLCCHLLHCALGAHAGVATFGTVVWQVIFQLSCLEMLWFPCVGLVCVWFSPPLTR